MKSFRSFIALISLALAFTAGAQIHWLETTHNFGAIDESVGPVDCIFKFVNTSSEPVSIVRAHASCGCTSPKYSRDAVAPGDTAAITVTYDPAGRPGKFTKTVAVDFSNNAPRTKLYITGTVVGSESTVAQRYPVDCSDKIKLSRGAVMFGEILKGQTRPVFLEAYNRSTSTIQPRVENLPPYITVDVTPDTVPPGQQFTYIFYIHTSKTPLYGVLNDSVTVLADNGAPACTIPTVAIVKEDFSKLTPKEVQKAPVITPDTKSLDFGHLSAETAQLTCTITNTGKSPLKIRRLYSAEPGVYAKISTETIKPGKSATVAVEINPAQIPGNILNARLQIISNDPTNPITNLRLVGEIKR